MSRTLYLALAMDLKGFGPKLKAAEQDLNSFQRVTGRLSNTLSKALGPALIGATAAAGYAAVQFGIDGVKAFLDDDAAAQKLATTLDNLGLAHDTTEVEAMIDALQRETGVADDALRPAFDRLVRSIGDTEQATSTLKLAMDVSAGSGKSLDTVVQALGKAYDGNTAGLSKLGAGINKAVLATGDMDTITKDLARTFGGQAQTASQTYQGQLSRLSIGFDELKESFGKGFLSGLSDASDQTGDLLESMQKLEPKMEKLGEGVYDFGVAAIDASTGLLDFKTNVETAANFSVARFSISLIRNADALGLVSDEAGAAAEAEYQLYLATNNLIGQMDPAARAAYALSLRYQGLAAAALEAANATTTGINQQAVVTSRYTGLAESLGKTIKSTGGNLKEYFASLDKGTTSTGAAAKETDLLTTAFDLQRGVVEKLQGTLEQQVSDLDSATAAAREYSTTLASQLLGGIDLGAAQQTGTELGISTLDAFDRQIAEAEWFGNVLTSIKASGADQRLIDQLAALGPAAGGKLAQEMIDKGLVQTFSDRLVDVIDTANTTAQAMVPEFLLAGVDSAEQFVDGTIEQLLKEQDRLKTIGKTIGKGIGKNIKAEIAQAVAEAVASAQAAKTAAAAERASEIAAQQVVVSEQQIAQALQRLIGNSNARAGYSMGIPVPTPVLG